MLSPLKTGSFLSNLIYEDWDFVRRELERVHMSMVGDPFDVNDSQGMLTLGKEEAWITFRGTGMVWSDIFSNFGFPVEWDGPGQVHSGYKKHFSHIRGLARQMAEQIPASIPLRVAGHSMGGDLATMYAAWINSGLPTDHKLAGLFTYGAPKALNAEAIAAIPCEVKRVTNLLDPAPLWPFIPGLSHPSGQIKINSGGWPIPWMRHASARYMRTVR